MIGGIEILLILFIGLLCLGTIIVLLGVILWLSQRSPVQEGGFPLVGIQKTQEDPLEILRRRYAQGEISKAEFEEMRDDLQGDETEKD